jgi:hypothetical protein
MHLKMKTTTLPPLRVTPQFRKAMRREQRDFVATALARSRKAKKTGNSVKGEVVIGRLEAMLAKAKSARR